MPSKKRVISVVLSEQGAVDLAGVLKLWLKDGKLFGPYVNCKSIDPNGPYFVMVIEEESGSDTIDIEVQVPHHYIRAVIHAPALKKLGFVPA